MTVSIVIVSFNAREHLERCLDAVAGGAHEVVVVDNASSDGSPALVRERFPSVKLVELAENVGFGAANNVGMEAAAGDLFLLLNSDAWPVGDAIERLAAFAAGRPRAGIVGPRLSNPDGSLQRSVRGWPTPWRLATEYLFLRRLGRGTRALNAFYGAGFDHGSISAVEVVKGAVMLVRRDVYEATGGFDPDFFMYGEEMDICYRVGRAGWEVVFDPEAEFVHVGGVSTGARWGERPSFGPMRREQLRGHLRFVAKHQGAGSAERARRILAAGLRLRGALFRGDAGRAYGEAAAWLRSGSTAELLAGRG
ncbi:MAG TPA: glycosyltransferase family 2 protein [Gaiellaceae bacterium]|nr:glycosyltransferase family 2 protein [Gaiellaceae bacterium]